LDAVRAQELDRRLDRSWPDEAEVRVARAHRIGRARIRRRARPVDVELLRAEAVREAAVGQLDETGAEHLGVGAVRPLPVGDGNDDVVELEPQLVLQADSSSSRTSSTPVCQMRSISSSARRYG